MEVEAGREEVGRRDGLPLPPASLLPPQLLLPPREGLARELATPRPRLGLARLAQPLGPAVPLPCTSRRRAISSAFSATMRRWLAAADRFSASSAARSWSTDCCSVAICLQHGSGSGGPGVQGTC